MRIILTEDLPGAEKHGLVANAEFDVVRHGMTDDEAYYIGITKDNVEFVVYGTECEEIYEGDNGKGD